MEWISDLLFKETVAHTIFIYCVVIALGVYLGKLKIFGVLLGITFVLFAGIAMGHFGFSANHQVIDFVRDFGLILFVFSIGLQVGPGFFSSFKKGGLSLNLMALIIVLLGGLTTLAIHFITRMSLPVLVGVLSGNGFVWMGYGAIITLLPVILVGFYSRIILKRNYFEICGLLSGSMTDPPALAYANSVAQSEAPAVAYATVYPLVMFLRIFIAQLLILFFV